MPKPGLPGFNPLLPVNNGWWINSLNGSIFFRVWQKPSIFDRVVVNISEEGIYAELSFDGCLIF